MFTDDACNLQSATLFAADGSKGNHSFLPLVVCTQQLERGVIPLNNNSNNNDRPSTTTVEHAIDTT
jgi:hypothetical protein